MVDNTLCDNEAAQLNALQVKVKFLKLFSRKQSARVVERSESTSSSSTASSSATLLNEGDESEQLPLQGDRHEKLSKNDDPISSDTPAASKSYTVLPIKAAEFRQTLEPKPLMQVSQKESRSAGNNHDDAAAPEIVTAQLQSTISRVYAPSLSFEDGLVWMANKKSKVSKDALRDDSYLDDLVGRDLVFLIDNSASMRSHQERVARAVRLLSWLLKKYDKNGFEVNFTRKFRKEYARPGHSSDLQKPLRKAIERGEGRSDVTNSLMRILRDFSNRDLPGVSAARAITSTIDRGIKHVSAANKIMIYVITDGDWEIGSESRITEKMHDITESLEMQGVPKNGVGIQFLRVNEKESVVTRLDLLKKCNFSDRIKIDSQPLEGDVFKSLLGPISNAWDHQNIDS